MSVTLILIIITVITSLIAWNNTVLQQKWIFNPYSVHHKKEYFRFITSGFIHSNSMHLLFNMIALYFFGGVIERIYLDKFNGMGILYLLITYLAGIVVSDLKTFSKYKEDPYYNSLGASGGVASILFASILYRPTSSIYLFFIPFPIPAFILGAGYLIYSYYSGKRMADNINHDAHLYGSLFGIFFTILLYPPVVVEFVHRIAHFNLYEFRFLMTPVFFN